MDILQLMFIAIMKVRVITHKVSSSLIFEIFISDRQTIIGSAKVSKFGDGSSNLNMQASYDVPMKQIEELIRLSETCTQEFQWDCYIAPLEIRGGKLLSWTDRKGNFVISKDE